MLKGLHKRQSFLEYNRVTKKLLGLKIVLLTTMCFCDIRTQGKA